MAQPIRILHVEDTRVYRGVIGRLLGQEPGKYALRQVPNRSEFETAFAEAEFDLVLTDLHIGDIDGLEVLDIVRGKNPDLPVIVVTGTGTEETALQAWHRGAADYVLKNPKHLYRLPIAIGAVMEKARLKKGQEEAVVALRASEERHRIFAELASDFVYVYRLEPDGRILSEWMSDSICRVLGYSPEKFRELDSAFATIHPDDLPANQVAFGRLLQGESVNFEVRVVTEKGEIRWLHNWARPKWNEQHTRVVGVFGAAQDITERKRAEEALRRSEERYRTLVEQARDGIALMSDEGRFQEVNPTYCSMTGYTRAELFGMFARDLIVPEQHATQAHELAETVAGGPHLLDWRVRRKDGTVFPAEVNAELLPDGRLLGMVRDISERKQAELTLRENERRLRQAVSAGNIGLWDWTLGTNMVYYSPEWKRQIGYDEHEIGNDFDEWQSRVHPDDLEPTLAIVRDYLAKPYPNYHVEFRFRHKDGSYRWIFAEGALIYDDSGKPVRMMGSHVDITERKQAEADRARLALIIESTPDFVSTCDRDLKFKYLNPAVRRALGVEDDEDVTQLTGRDFRAPADFGQLLNDIVPAAMRDGSWTGESKWHARDGRTLLISQVVIAHKSADGAIESFSTVARDITVRKRAEEALREREQQLRLFVEHSPAALAMFDRGMRYLVVSRRWLSDYHLNDQELIGRSHYDVFPDVPERWKEIHRRCLAGAIERCEDDPFPRADGTTDWVRWEMRPWYTAQGEVGGVILVTEDITERKQAEEALRRERDRFDVIVECVPGGISAFQMSLEGKTWYSFLSDRFVEIAGINQEILARDAAPFLNLIHADDKELAMAAIVESARKLSPFQLEYRIQHPLKGEVWLETRSTPSRQQDGSVLWYGITLDITERKRSAEEIRNSRERLTTLSRQLIAAQETERRQLALELHDELGQVLTLVKMNVQAARRAFPDKGQERLSAALGVTEQAIAQVRGLSLELRPSMLDDFGLKAALEWYVERCRNAESAVELEGNLGEERFAAEVETTCFRVVQEAVTNALKHAGARRIGVQVQHSGHELCVKVVDDGAGFDVAACRDRAARGDSTGLLSMEERVHLLGGQFVITSAPGQGAEVRAIFPLGPGRAAEKHS